MPEPAARAFDCIHYAGCLNPAAAADTSFPCPCERYRRDPRAVTWRDVEAARRLVVAILRPDVWQLLMYLSTLDDTHEKWATLRAAWPALGLRRRDILRARGR